jgi:hypothetical protein
VERLPFVRLDTLNSAVRDDPTRRAFKMPVLVAVKALQTFEKFAEL